MTDNKQQQANQPRRLSFVDDQSLPNSISEAKKSFAASTERRQSVWNPQRTKSIFTRRVSHSLSHSSRKSSQDLTPKIKYQNTYRTEPEENERFQAYKIEPKLYAMLKEALKDKKFHAIQSGPFSKELSQDILREVKLLMNNLSPRYKLVSHVVIGEMLDQDIRFGSRCLWDTNYDNSASVVYKNGSLYAVATVFAIYFE